MSRLPCRFFLIVLLIFCIPNLVNAADANLQIKQEKSTLIVSAGKLPIMQYRFGDAPFRPYVRELYTPGGVQILRDSPPDHVHHRGLMYGIFVNGVDFWSEQPKCGKQVHVELGNVEGSGKNGLALGKFTQKLKWLAPGAQQEFLVEQRSLTVFRADDLPATLLTWRTKLQPGTGAGSVKLTGSHYDGLGMRFLVSMDRDGKFLYASGKPGPIVRGSERVTPDRWAAFTAKADGKTVTAAIFDDPRNVRHPAGMFTMDKPFAYLSATPNIWKNPLVLEPNQTLDLRYGIAAWDGEMAPDQIAALYQRWLKLD